MRLVGVVAKLFVFTFAVIVLGQGMAPASGDVQKGKAAFVTHGCWQCHDYAGQGSIMTSAGKVLTRTQLPFDAFKSIVREGNGAMPPYRPAILSDNDLDDIFAYLQSLPPPKSAKDIPLLDSVRTQ